MLLFEDEDRIEDFHAFRAQGLRKRQLLQVREKVFSQLEGLLAGKDDGLFVLSAEAISHRHFQSAKERLRRWLEDHIADWQVLAYVRGPIGYMRSVLQYHAQNGTTKGRFFFEYPCYRGS